MKWIVFVLLTTIFVILFTVLFSQSGTIKKNSKPQNTQTAMTITSPVFNNNAYLDSRYTCDGRNINPPLRFSDIPQEAKSLVLLVEDPDAPSGTYHHWTIYNMSPSTSDVQEGAGSPSGKEGITDFGRTGYGGPCPPTGTHRYFFKLYALDTLLDLPDNATYNEIVNAMENHVLDQADIIGLYSRQR